MSKDKYKVYRQYPDIERDAAFEKKAIVSSFGFILPPSGIMVLWPVHSSKRQGVFFALTSKTVTLVTLGRARNCGP